LDESANLQPTIEMKAKRRRHDSAFKARVAREAVKEEKTIHQITKKNWSFFEIYVPYFEANILSF
jgi:hypothetical protein